MIATVQRTTEAPAPPLLGYSSLGLPLWCARDRERESLLEAVFGDYGYKLLELHIESTTYSPAIGSRVLDDIACATLRSIAAGVSKRGGRLALGLGARYLLGPTKH